VFADKLPHLYTLVVRKDNTFSVLVDGVSAKEGSLLSDMDPPVNPSKVTGPVARWPGGGAPVALTFVVVAACPSDD
jgi:hypothetical protein